MNLKFELLNKTKLKKSDLKKYTIYFSQILDSVIINLNIEKNYIFSVVFVDDKKMQKINLKYRNINSPTDVITFALLDNADEFEYELEEIELGDIFINVDAIERQALEYNHSNIREASFLFTHGILHLFGYDHMNVDDEKEMFSLQDKILDKIIKREVK